MIPSVNSWPIIRITSACLSNLIVCGNVVATSVCIGLVKANNLFLLPVVPFLEMTFKRFKKMFVMLQSAYAVIYWDNIHDDPADRAWPPPKIATDSRPGI